ncbi:amino acid ABC transporter ATP-binding protein [Hoeflea ulvae]|uniref:Amino acid ABC transporter ATP-binding protein n=1 Tax=Hoeflea ulvae TaxID=2983764 RepID=A0ABT3YD28_9HYPH|nr:amino acid ABC transporter ATP-binding protein [Hoeflea ulvae]MCY0093790.1 amino acid ABC transporter ATP-binding protein [Hoeflea ulvae]
MPHLTIDSLSASYATVPVLHDVSLSVEQSEVVSIIGPSGSGKSTLLRTLVGIAQPTNGTVTLGGLQLDYRSPASLRTARDSMAIVFQQYNLFQNMTVLGNVTIAPLKIKKWPKKDVEETAKVLLDKVGLGHKLDAYPDELSGGQQQRVAIARALALKPKLLLLDEVTSALDPELVGEVLDTIRGLAIDGMTMLIVSHEMGFVRDVSSRIVMMDAGRIVEVGPPEQIFQNPQLDRTREFTSRILSH